MNTSILQREKFIFLYLIPAFSCCISLWVFKEKRLGFLMLLALLMSVPFLFSSHIRIYAPGVIPMYLIPAAMFKDNRLGKICLVLITILFLSGTVLNYNDRNTGLYDLKSPKTVEIDVPFDHYWKTRQTLVDRFIRHS